MIALVAAAAIAFFTILTLATWRTVDPRPVGTWKLVESGSWKNVSWELFSTNPNGGGRCLAIETEPPVYGRMDVPAEDLYSGKVPHCAPSPGEGRSRYVRLFEDTEPLDGDFNYLIGETAPEITQVRVALGRETTPQEREFAQEEIVDTSKGFIVFLYDRTSRLLTLQPLQDGNIKKDCPVIARKAILILHC